MGECYYKPNGITFEVTLFRFLNCLNLLPFSFSVENECMPADFYESGVGLTGNLCGDFFGLYFFKSCSQDFYLHNFVLFKLPVNFV